MCRDMFLVIFLLRVLKGFLICHFKIFKFWKILGFDLFAFILPHSFFVLYVTITNVLQPILSLSLFKISIQFSFCC